MSLPFIIITRVIILFLDEQYLKSQIDKVLGQRGSIYCGSEFRWALVVIVKVMVMVIAMVMTAMEMVVSVFCLMTPMATVLRCW